MYQGNQVVTRYLPMLRNIELDPCSTLVAPVTNDSYPDRLDGPGRCIKGRFAFQKLRVVSANNARAALGLKCRKE
jgi:hypothetical protein